MTAGGTLAPPLYHGAASYVFATKPARANYLNHVTCGGGDQALASDPGGYHQGGVRDLTYDRLLELARAANGETLRTIRGREYTVGERRHKLFFTPASSAYDQSEGRKAHQRFVERCNEVRGDRPGGGADEVRNASYLIGLLRWAAEPH